MNLLVTGGTGFFGRALLRKWVCDEKEGIRPPEVTILTRDPASFFLTYPEFKTRQWLTLHKGNVLDYASLPHNNHFTHILHAATESTIGPSLPALQRYDEIVSGTRNLLDYAVKNNVNRFLLTSSGGVYGPQPKGLEKICETFLGIPDPLDASSAYSMGKRAAEHLCCLYNDRYGLDSVIARCFSFVGRDLPMTAHFAIGNFINDALYGAEINVAGDGSPLRSYMNQADLAQWLLCILDQGVAGRAYNVGSDQGISISDLAYLVKESLSPNKPVVFKNKKDIYQGRNIYIPDISAVKRDLDLQLTISLRESIEEFLI
ncbi:NAD(P)-dependent oxidoreductase [Porticoccaceae bacterium]|nr:NAD(P)-dependent oxidoreductase [Porticoccaceae bacterium]